MEKRILFFLLVLLGAGFTSKISAQNPFITTWQTTDGTITIPIISIDSLIYNYDVEWTNLTNPGEGDGSDTGISTAFTISGLNNNDTYEIKISGDFPAIYFLGSADAAKIQSIEQWGDIEWQVMNYAFWQCSNLTSNATDAPDLSLVTSLFATFGVATSFNSDLNNWNVSSIKDMTGTFFGATSFNGNISNWSTYNVENMSQMFDGATSFNQDIGNWSVSSVTSMYRMFRNASAFNQSLSNWFTIDVTNMREMFSGATSFNQSLGDWYIRYVTNMTGMLDNSGLSKANYDATLRGWESFSFTPTGITLGATGLTYCNAADSRTTLTGTGLNWVINGDVLECDPFITTWQTSDGSITIPAYTFGGESYLYEVSWANLTNAGEGEGSDSEITGNYTISELNTGDLYEVTISGNFPRIYFQNFNLSAADRAEILSIEQWGDQEWTNMSGAFSNCVNLISNATDSPLLNKVTSLSSMFSGATSFTGDLSRWNVSTVNDMGRMFENASSFNSDLNDWNMSNVNSVGSMFRGASNFDSDLSTWNVSNVNSMSSMFNGATSFNKPLDSWDVSNVSSMNSMFENASSFNGDISNWSVNNVSSMSRMFKGATAFNGDLSDWNVGNVNRMNEMFADATAFNSDISGWDVRKVREMQRMFNGATAFNRDLSDWNVAEVRQMGGMFWNATSFNQNLGNWDISSLEPVEVEASPPFGIDSLFTNSGLSIINYDSTLIGWSTLSNGETRIPTAVNLGAQNLNFCSSVTARAKLIEDFGWTIYDKGPGCAAPGTQASDITFSNIGTSEMDISWTNGDGTRRLVLARATDAVNANPDDLNSYSASTEFGEGQELGSGNFVVYIGTGNSFTLSGLSEGTIYHIRVYEFNGALGLQAYNTVTASGNPDSQATLSVPEIISFTPDSAGQGRTVVISGTGLRDVNTVSFGGTAANSFIVESDTLITAEVGQGSSGNVLVSAPGGTSIKEGFKFISPPVITSFEPTTASIGDTVNIRGSNFSNADLISFGGATAAYFNVESDTLIIAVVGDGETGSVLVSTPGGTSSLAGFNLEYAEIAVFSSDNSIITQDPSKLIFLGRSIGEEIIQNDFVILNLGNSDLVTSAITSSDPRFTIVEEADTIKSGEIFQFSLQFTASAVGTYESEISIQNNSFNAPEFVFTVTAERAGVNIKDNETDSVIISNEDINLGSTQINVDVDKNFIIENLSSSSTIEILSITVDNPVFQIIDPPTSIAPLSSAEFTVRLIASEVGDYTGTVTVTTNLNEFSFQVAGSVLPEASTDLQVYNVVTPNGDGRHDLFEIENIGEFPNNKVSIFNRWGNRVFEITGYDNDSRVFTGISDNGEELLTGNYYYVIDKGNGDKRISGFLLLKR